MPKTFKRNSWASSNSRKYIYISSAFIVWSAEVGDQALFNQTRIINLLFILYLSHAEILIPFERITGRRFLVRLRKGEEIQLLTCYIYTSISVFVPHYLPLISHTKLAQRSLTVPLWSGTASASILEMKGGPNLYEYKSRKRQDWMNGGEQCEVSMPIHGSDTLSNNKVSPTKKLDSQSDS